MDVCNKRWKEYFIKRFLNPKFPRPDGPGSEEIKRKLRIECEQFDKHQRQLNEKVKEIAGLDGRLVFSSDFFSTIIYITRSQQKLSNQE